jgi:hypothetical protein
MLGTVQLSSYSGSISKLETSFFQIGHFFAWPKTSPRVTGKAVYARG